MQIACPQCSMQYDLDPRLLPPAGASVQCTRCSFVFTALPSGEIQVPGSGQGGASPKAPAVGTSTQVFGSPYAASGKLGVPTTTQVFGAVSVPGAPPLSDKTPAFGSGVLPPPSDKTPAFGSGTVASSPAAVAPLPAASKTQVFGAPPVPPSAPVGTTTQVFGAPSVPPPTPEGTTTQVFGSAAVAAKAPSPATTQVFGAASVGAPLPTTATTQMFGSAEVQAARKAMEPGALAPWLAEPGPAPAPSRSAPPIALPEEPVALPGSPAPSFPQPEPLVSRGGPVASSRHSAPLELPPEMLVPSPGAREGAASAQASGGGKERLLLILAAIVALGLTAWLSYPVWQNRGSELSGEALAAKDQAVSLLRRDDATSRQHAIDMLRGLLAQFPKFTEAQAELVVAISLQLDDVKAELEFLHLEEQRVQRDMAALEVAKATADWQSRVNARRQELAALGAQKQPLEAATRELIKQLDQLVPSLRAAPETEPAADVVARLKALAVYEGVRGNAQAIGLAERLGKVESPQLWSIVTRVEYALNAPSPVNALPELSDALAKVREQDKTFFRAYVLGARLAMRLNGLAEAQSLLGTVVALNPHHTLALKLQKRAAAAGPSP